MKLHFFIIFSLFFTSLAFAQNRNQLSYQGRVSQEGKPYSGKATVSFAIGNLWTEQQEVDIRNGIYSITLGKVTPIPNTVFSNTGLSLRITFNGKTLVPDVPFYPVPYSYMALSVDKDAIEGYMIKDKTIESKHLANGTIKTTNLEANSINTTLIADKSILPADLKPEGTNKVMIVDANGDANWADQNIFTSANNTLSQGKIWIGNADNLRQEITFQGDIVLNNLGFVTINAGSVNSAKILDGSILNIDLADNSVNSNKILDNSIVPIDMASGGNDKVLTTNANGVVNWADKLSLISASTGWALTGNAGTVAGTNFIGTTDAQPLVFKVNGQLAGRIDFVYTNTFYGYQAGNANTTGSANTFLGLEAGLSTTTGYSNTYVGLSAGRNNTLGGNNTFLGRASGIFGTGSNNTFVGFQAGAFNGGSGNVFLGFDAGYNETGSNKLYIANSNTSTPLIYGDFGTNALQINGSLRINTGANTLNFPNSRGTSGNTLQSDGLGFITWAAAGSSGWNLTGNTLTGTEFIGSISNHDFIFRTNNTEKMRITSAGNVGIGTATTNAPLQFSNSTVNRKIVLWDNLNNDHQFVGMGNLFQEFNFQVDATATNFVWRAGTSATTSNELMRLKGNGNLGIGTSNPTSMFSVGATSQFQVNSTGNIVRINDVPTSFPSAQGGAGTVLTNNGTGTLTWAAAGGSGWNLTGNILTGTEFIGSISNHDFILRTNNTEKMRILANGNINIPTTTATGLGIITQNGLRFLHSYGTENTFLGANAGNLGITGAANTFVGSKAGEVVSSGFFNTFLGTNAGAKTNIGVDNMFVGAIAGFNNITGSRNVYSGSGSGEKSTGDNNTFVGYRTGGNLTSGNSNVFLGHEAGYNEITASNKLYIANTNTSTPLIWGDFLASQLKVNGSLEVTGFITTNIISAGSLVTNGAGVIQASDRRLKENIIGLKSVLPRIMQLNGYRYNLIGNKETEIGVIAQEIEAQFPEISAKIQKDGKEYVGVKYDRLTAVLIEAIKEQQAQIEALKLEKAGLKSELEGKIQNQQTELDSLKKQMSQILELLSKPKTETENSKK